MFSPQVFVMTPSGKVFPCFRLALRWLCYTTGQLTCGSSGAWCKFHDSSTTLPLSVSPWLFFWCLSMLYFFANVFLQTTQETVLFCVQVFSLLCKKRLSVQGAYLLVCCIFLTDLWQLSWRMHIAYSYYIPLMGHQPMIPSPAQIKTCICPPKYCGGFLFTSYFRWMLEQKWDMEEVELMRRHLVTLLVS